MIWDIVGPILALILSAIFTIWHTRRVRKEAIKQAYDEQYLSEVEQWANHIIALCNLIKEFMTSTDFTNVLTKQLDLVEAGARFCLIKTFGDELSDAIFKATNFLSSLPDKRKWNDNEVKTLREYVNVVKDIISDLRYGK